MEVVALLAIVVIPWIAICAIYRAVRDHHDAQMVAFADTDNEYIKSENAKLDEL